MKRKRGEEVGEVKTPQCGENMERRARKLY